MEFNITLSEKEDEFINAYFEAIYFTQGFDVNGVDIDDDCRREQTIDALCFFSQNQCYLSDDQVSQAGHDFWLTRNGHGTGFWDRDCYPDHIKERLSARAGQFGETFVYDETGKDYYE